MTTFDNREQGFELQFVTDEKVDFNTEARCCKIFGLWVAKQLGISDADATAYALTVVESNLDEPGFGDVLRKVSKDFEEKGITPDIERMKQEMEIAFIEAKRQLADEAAT